MASVQEAAYEEPVAMVRTYHLLQITIEDLELNKADFPASGPGVGPAWD
jgi:hypothetical protein